MLDREPDFGETVYHAIKGEGTIVYIDTLCYYGVRFSKDQKDPDCIHTSSLYYYPVDSYGNPINDAIKDFHANRTIFAVIDDSICYKNNSGQSHKEWFFARKWINTLDDPEFDKIIRGYKDESGIYFYRGDFDTDDELELYVKRNIGKILDTFGRNRLDIYCGLIKGKPGTKFKPKNYICTI